MRDESLNFKVQNKLKAKRLELKPYEILGYVYHILEVCRGFAVVSSDICTRLVMKYSVLRSRA